jgi:hypothetical protein
MLLLGELVDVDQNVFVVGGHRASRRLTFAERRG